MANFFAHRSKPRWTLALAGLLIAGLFIFALAATANPVVWQMQWPNTDFKKHSIDLNEIMSGGPPKDGIPSIDKPEFTSIGETLKARALAATEPVVSIAIGGDVRAYPLRILIWHEIVNDVVGGVPIAITYCPLCNSAIVFDRRLDGRVLEFGTTGNLRNSDLIMYDRQTESWWQQFLGEAIVGELTGKRLAMLPARVEAFAVFHSRAPAGKVMIPPKNFRRAYGMNPYSGYDSKRLPFLYNGSMPKGIEPMAYVLMAGGKAWSLELIRRKKRIEDGDMVITWSSGQNSALDQT
ncbi:MAG: DUF3179 domain-containing protein, partial [Alphaproteobacteria bacterium]